MIGRWESVGETAGGRVGRREKVKRRRGGSVGESTRCKTVGGWTGVRKRER
jgi:hypothetical protein